MQVECKIIIIGGSAGSLPILSNILNGLPDKLKIPVVIVLHRQRNVQSEMERILATYSPNKKIIEPEDKQPINDCCVYLAPQNYHLLIEADKTFSLDYSEPVLYSRPSIDVTFESTSKIYTTGVLALLLSGANNDGALGVSSVLRMGGTALVQEPASAEFSVMPKAALDKNARAQSLSPDKIVSFIKTLIANQSAC